MNSIETVNLNPDASNAPINSADETNFTDFPAPEKTARYRYSYSNGCHLDALLVNKNSDTLVVSFHGALNRDNFSIPRFERLKTLLQYSVNSLYFSDPALWLDESLQLAWFTGWSEIDFQKQIAELIVNTAQGLGADRIILTGSSGGGFAALQISALIPGSLAVPFNPQTDIQAYLIDGKKGAHGAVRKYIEVVQPELIEDTIWNIDYSADWSIKTGDQLSALSRYSKPTENTVLYCQSPGDWHHEQHYAPFLLAAAKGNNLARITVLEYGTRIGHFPPTPDEFGRAIESALSFRNSN